MHYTDIRASMVNICHTLQDLGWKIYGYKPDESDSMTDYYSPAGWDGIATKNGYTLAVNCEEWKVKQYSGKEIFEYHAPPIEFKSSAKIEQLQRLADNKAATEGEKLAAEEAIKRLYQSVEDAKEKAEREKVLIEQFPIFQQNPPSCNWHIERDGKIIAKGRGAFQFSSLPYWVDHMTGQKRDGWYSRWDGTLSEDEKKNLAKFQAFIKKVESVVAVKIGDGPDETQYETIKVTEYKTENKPQENPRGSIRVGQKFILKSNFDYGCFKGRVYEIARISDSFIYAYTMDKKYKKLCTGHATRGNRFGSSLKKFEEWIAKEMIAFCDIVEVKTPYEVEKCVKVKPEKIQQQRGKDEQIDPQPSVALQVALEISQDTDTRDDSKIFVVKMLESLTREQYKQVNKFMKINGGYYSKFKRGFIFRDGDPTNNLASIMKNT